MTLGQRIAQKRKELGLSQEGLGEQLGVSRQAIYKWESDASLPEIEKLIALSRLFSVTVGWLLGVEEEPHPAGEEELTPRQLAMVREITEGYLSARPEGVPPRRNKLLTGLLVGSCCLAGVVLVLAIQLSQITHKYDLLQQTVVSVDQNVQEQIHSIAQQVEDTLAQSYSLVKSSKQTFVSMDPGAGTALFQVQVIPKHYTQGTTALFLAQGDGKTLETPGQLDEDYHFSAQVVAPLSNEITFSVVFLTGEERIVQQLGSFRDLYDQSFPPLSVSTSSPLAFRDGLLPSDGSHVIAYRLQDSALPGTPQRGYPDFCQWDLNAKMGLFQDDKPVAWYEPKAGADHEFRIPQDITLEPEHTYYEAALLTDPYGRQRLYPGKIYHYDSNSQCWKSEPGYPPSTGLAYPVVPDSMP